jgi:ABC-type lipoprotein release transport system permease subunit
VGESKEEGADELSKMFRWITPIALGILSLAVTVLIAVISSMNTEIRAVRDEVVRSNEQSRQFATQYTDKMIELILKTSEKKK